jgi:hypothetical protein
VEVETDSSYRASCKDMPRRKRSLPETSAPVPPDPSAFTRKEWAVITRCATPHRVQQYLRTLPYNWAPDTLMTFRRVVEAGRANCIEAALTAAAIMEQHGHPPLLLDLASADRLDHVLFLFSRHGRWGTIGKSRDVGLHGRKPVFRTVRDVALSYVDPYVDGSGRLTGYGVADLRDLLRCDWRFSTRSVWAVERFLIALPHKPLKVSRERHRRMLERFRRFKRSHPDRPFTEYRGRDNWM